GVMVCNGDGDIMVLSGNAVIADKSAVHKNFFDMLSHVEILGNDFQRVTYEISSGVAGAAYLNNGEAGAYCSYYPLKISSLNMISIIPEDAMVYNFRTSESDMWSMVFVVAVFAGAAIICILAIRMSDNKAVERIKERIEESERYAAKQREMLNFALKNSSTHIWEYDIQWQELTIQENGTQIIIEEGPNYYIDNDRIHPDDIVKYLSIYSRINSGEAYVFDEIRTRESGEGAYNWVRMEGYVIFDEDNEPVRAMLASKDITAQKSIQQQYENEVQLRQLTDPSLAFVLRINLTTGAVEDKSCHNKLFSDLLNFATFSEINSYITDRVVNESDRRRVKTELTSRHLIHLFNRGIYDFETEYRRVIKGDIVHWIKITITSMRSPTTDDILSFVYIRDINSQKILELTTRATINDEYEYVACLDMPSDMIYAVKVDVESGERYYVEEERFSQRVIRLAAGELPMTAEQMEALSPDGIRRNLKDNDSYSDFFVVEQPDGTVKRKKVHYSYIDEEKELVLFNRIDVTDVYEEEQRKNVRLTRALIEAEKAKKARGDFLAHMSHEIRTPLNDIRGMLDIIKSNPYENLDLYLDKAIISSKHLTGLINDILDMSRIDSGKMELAMEWVELDDIRKYTDAIITPLTEEKQQHFELEYNNNGFTGVYTDEARIKQIFINLLSNAVKYTPNGGKISCIVSVVPCDDEDDVLMHAIIADNGIGMSAKFLRHAFEPFAQAEKDFNRKGTGLGLPITKSIVELMNGSINVESRINKGTRISFDVKLKGRKFDATASTASDMFMGRRALVVDDHDINLIIAEKMLTSFGLEAFCAANGKEALEMFEKSPKNFFDIIFMDMMMPVMDGKTAVKAIHELDREDARTVEIIAMTANTFAEYKEELAAVGITSSLSKPFSRDQLLQLLRKTFDDRKLEYSQGNITV
ncbi:MAG: response regulator, partial [Oscillospiraceae bacterium]|nr:response regulator [Oscillospiraceae bacterium]